MSMFDMLSNPGFPSEFQSSSSASYVNHPTLMMDSRCLLENRGAWMMGKPVEEPNGGLYRMCTSDVEDDDGLELSLGLSVGGSSSRTKKSSKLPKDPSGNFSLYTEAPIPSRMETSKGELGAAEQPLPVDVLASQNLLFVRKDQKKCEASLTQTRDQVWETLQRKNSESSQDTMHVDGAAALQELKHASASLWGRRSNSMQLVVGMKEGSDRVSQPIRRLSSNGASVNINMLPPQLYDSAPAPLSRQVSSVESLLEKGMETPTVCPQRQEALERQRKMEQQALRRQEARRRRKCLIVEKQHKKARKDDRGIPFEPRICASGSPKKISSAYVDIQEGSYPLGQLSDVHQRLTNKETSQPAPDKSGMLRVSRIGDDMEYIGGRDRVAEDRHKSLELGVNMESSAERKASSAFVEDLVVDMEALPSSDSCVDLQSFYSGGLEQESITRGKVRKVRRPASTQGDVPAPSIAAQKVATQARERNICVGINEAAGKICRSSTSESESGDTNEEHSTVQNECGEVDALSSKYAAAESSQCVGSGLSFPSMNSLAYPPPFPVLPIPYPVPVAGAPSAAIPLQLGFSLPCFMQYPSAGGGENSNPSSSQLSASFTVPGSAALPPFRFPMPDGSYPWFPVMPAGGAAPQPAPSQSSRGTPVARSPSNECKAEHSKGKCLEDIEKSAVTNSPGIPIQRTSSKSYSKDHVGTLLPPSPKRGDCVASVPVSHRKHTVGPSSPQHESRKESPSVDWILPVERQHSVNVANRPASQDSGTVDQSSLRSHNGVQNSHLAGEEPLCENESRPDKARNCDSKNFSAGLKQEEGSAESQLASENSSQEVSIEPPVALDGQKSGSIPELPWVSTTGVGPNGKTISGVMYISSRRQIRLVCCCHGKHMSPAEFVEHSGSIDLSNPERNILVNPFPFLSQVATTPV